MSVETSEKYVEQRRAKRRSAYMRASIVYPRQTENLSCIVRNVSQDGALIDFPLPTSLPPQFWLRLEGDAALNLCSVAQHSAGRLGVEFSELIRERVERLRVERWTKSRSNWSRLAAQPQDNSPIIGIPNSAK